MSQTTLFIPSHAGGVAAHGKSSAIRLLFAVAVLSAAVGSVATTLLDRVVSASAAPPPAPVPALRPAPAAPGDTTVPDASAVFAGREVRPEETAPSF